MRPADSTDEIAAIKAAAQTWYEGELARAEAGHSARWPEHRNWVLAYLHEELRRRLAARGWQWPET